MRNTLPPPGDPLALHFQAVWPSIDQRWSSCRCHSLHCCHHPSRSRRIHNTVDELRRPSSAWELGMLGHLVALLKKSGEAGTSTICVRSEMRFWGISCTSSQHWQPRHGLALPRDLPGTVILQTARKRSCPFLSVVGDNLIELVPLIATILCVVSRICTTL